MNAPTPHLLGPNDEVEDHPITTTANYESDLALLNYLLQDLRALIRQARRGDVTLHDQQVINWEVHGLARRTVICDPARLMEIADVQLVGFFGDRRAEANKPVVDQSEFDLIDEFANYPGIMSYSSVELDDGYWANLVVHREPDDREAWRGSEVHRDAVDRVAPMAYHGVRIHNGCILDGVAGTQTAVLECTKYWDYDVEPTWHAIRTLPGGETIEPSGPGAKPSEPPT
ncbi:MAG: hypothetical protein P8J50_00740 [Acidimicrobiales bacterium]|jgi:hypothetical protein|nr:hypothetical protein [Acidimicrobiales bacterium]